MARVYNFNPGPATLPLEVLEQAQSELLDYQGTGMSILEASHRGKEYMAVHQEACDNIRKLLNLSEEYAVLFLQGGASLQFAMVPLNLLRPGESADYVHSGSWASKAIKEARIVGRVNVVADTSRATPAQLPPAESIKATPGAVYLHLTSNETIEGIQWKKFPAVEVPLVADMSSDICSRPLDVRPFGLIYAGAQKNLGPAGVTLVIIRRDLVDRAPESLPVILRYKTHVEENSLYNTPPCFAVYLVALVTRWILRQGGLEAMARRNAEKAKFLYDVLDASGFYRGCAAKEYRSDMNVTFRLPTEALEEQFLKEASAQGFKGLKGHRSVGGIRASLYNAFPVEGARALADFMREFERRHG